MQKKHARQYIIITPAPGDIVILKITREDRSATDNLRTYCRVVEQKHPNRYRLLSKHGLLVMHSSVSHYFAFPMNQCRVLGYSTEFLLFQPMQ